MTDMVEKVAQAIWYAENPDDWSQYAGVTERTVCRRAARAAICALMEPTEKMLKAGRRPLASGAVGEDIVWQAMLKAALDEPEIDWRKGRTESGEMM